MEKSDDDRISALPDCLLLEILSRLPSTMDAIRTGTLSKRWEHLWTWVPTLVFSLPTQYRQNPKSMCDFPLLLDKTLTQCRQLKLKKFEVHTFYAIRFESQFKDWIRFAVSCNVEELNLTFWNTRDGFKLDQFLFTNSCLTDLRLSQCKLNPTGPISWPNLRSLCISRVKLDEDLLVNILSGSPLLETLVLEYCNCNLPIITYYYSDSESESEAEIDSPSSCSTLSQCPQLKQLKNFKVCTSLYTQFQPQINNWIRYAIRCNVKEVNLQFWNMDSINGCLILDQIFFTTSCFTNLRLNGCMVNPVGAISWKSLGFLCISGCNSLDEGLIENILCGSPLLETLVLHECEGYRVLDMSSSKSVKNLVLSGGYMFPYGKSEDEVIEINAPNISSLKLESGTFLCKPLLLNMSPLVKVHLSYTCGKQEPEEAEREMLEECIMSLCHVKELKIEGLYAKVVSCLEAKGFVFPSNVKLTGVRRLIPKAVDYC